MKEINGVSIKADTYGIAASALCFVHCVATPFIFLAKACTISCCSEAPIWWQAIDYIFIVISFIAVLYASKHSRINWLRAGLWVSWFFLLFAMLHESLNLSYFGHYIIYIPAIALIILHFYNMKFCTCNNEHCSTIVRQKKGLQIR